MGLSGRAKALRIALVGALTLLVALPAGGSRASTAEIATNGNGPSCASTATPRTTRSRSPSRRHLHGHGHHRRHARGRVHPGRHRRHLPGRGHRAHRDQRRRRAATPARQLRRRPHQRRSGSTTRGRDGNDILNSGSGGIDPDLCLDTPPFRCLDPGTRGTASTAAGWDTCSPTPTAPGGSPPTCGPAANLRTTTTARSTALPRSREIVGGLASDELIGGLGPDSSTAAPGAPPDTICGGLGKDTVDYSDKTAGVTVTLDGVLPTDPDITATRPTSPSERARTAARRGSPAAVSGTGCRAPTPTRYPCQGCPDPGATAPLNASTAPPTDGVPGENDCIGEDIENIIGSPHDDVLIGNDPDALYGQGPRVEPAGENVLEGGGGDDLLDGSLGADLYRGGDRIRCRLLRGPRRRDRRLARRRPRTTGPRSTGIRPTTRATRSTATSRI